jgi:Response regulator containing CheY-like receiver, AAA-type ATPase, and DNA-binding domains
MPALAGRVNLLVIDDSPDFQVLIKTYLLGSSLSCLCAADSIQATGIALRQKVHVILLDIGLPGGDGLMLLDRLRANTRTRAIPIIVATAQSTPGLEAKARAKGAVAFLQKPIDKQILLETLQQVLQESAHATTVHS